MRYFQLVIYPLGGKIGIFNPTRLNKNSLLKRDYLFISCVISEIQNWIENALNTKHTIVLCTTTDLSKEVTFSCIEIYGTNPK